MKVRLVRKLANRINDVDLTGRAVGEEFDVSERDARVLVAEGWAELTEPLRRRADDRLPPPRSRSRKTSD